MRRNRIQTVVWIFISLVPTKSVSPLPFGGGRRSFPYKINPDPGSRKAEAPEYKAGGDETGRTERSGIPNQMTAGIGMIPGGPAAAGQAAGNAVYGKTRPVFPRTPGGGRHSRETTETVEVSLPL